MTVSPSTVTEAKRHRPRWITVFAAAFVAGATAAVGINSFLDVHLSQRKPQVECEPIFVALRSLPQGAPVTVWDVALKDWPKAMLPASALRAHDSFEGFVLRHAVREGQPLLAVQLVRADGGLQHHATAAGEAFTSPTPAGQPAASASQTDLWAPEESVGSQKPAPRSKPEPQATVAVTPRAAVTPVVTKPASASTDIDPPTTSTAAAETVTRAEKPADTSATTIPAAPNPPAATIAATTPAQPPLPPEPVAAAKTEPTVREPSPATVAPVAPAPTDVDSPALAATQPPVGEPTPAPDISTMPSVVVAEAGGRPAEESRGSAGTGGRFLVVPERIALQADTSFAQPRRPQSPSVAPAQRAKQPTPRPSTGSRRDAATRGQKQPQQRTPSTQATGQRTWGSFFPNIAAGMESLSGQSQRSRSSTEQKTPARR